MGCVSILFKPGILVRDKCTGMQEPGTRNSTRRKKLKPLLMVMMTPPVTTAVQIIPDHLPVQAIPVRLSRVQSYTVSVQRVELTAVTSHIPNKRNIHQGIVVDLIPATAASILARPPHVQVC